MTETSMSFFQKPQNNVIRQKIIEFFQKDQENNDIDDIFLSESSFLKIPVINTKKENEFAMISIEEFLIKLEERKQKELEYMKKLSSETSQCISTLRKMFEKEDNGLKKEVERVLKKITFTVNELEKLQDRLICTKFYNLWQKTKRNDVKINFTTYVHAVLWKPLIESIPSEALKELQEKCQLIAEQANDEKLKQIEKDIEQYGKMAKIIEVKDKNIDSEELESILRRINTEKKKCNVVVRDIISHQSIIEEYRDKCIYEIEIVTEVATFLETTIEFGYDKLVLKERIDKEDIKNVFDKIHWGIRKLKVDIDIDDNDYSINDQQEDHDVGPCCKELKEYFSKLPLLNYIDLDLRLNKITAAKLKEILKGFLNLTNLSFLRLDLWLNKIEEKGAKKISTVLKCLPTIRTLDLNLWSNNIKKNGAISIADGLGKLVNLQNLSLYLGSNAIEDEGVESILKSLEKIEQFERLILDFSSNKIKNSGAKWIANTMEKLKIFKNMNLDLRYNNIEDSGAEIISKAAQSNQYMNNLHLKMGYNSIGPKGKSALLSLENKIGFRVEIL